MRIRSWWVLGTASLAIVLGGCGSGFDKVSEKVEEAVGAKKGKETAKKPAPKGKKPRQEQARQKPDRQAGDEPVAKSSVALGRFQREWFVSPKGSDQAQGSREKPFRTINRAIAAAGPGEAIRVQAGEYPESIVIDGKAEKGRKDAPITLLGDGKPKVVPGKSSGALLQVRRPYWIVVRGQKLVRLGRQRPGLRMDSNRYAAGGLFKAEPKETRDFSQWKQLSGVDMASSVER